MSALGPKRKLLSFQEARQARNAKAEEKACMEVISKPFMIT